MVPCAVWNEPALALLFGSVACNVKLIREVKLQGKIETRKQHFHHICTMEQLSSENNKETTVILRPHGPLVINGNFVVTDEHGKELQRKPQMSFCRCRQSKNMPFCDGSHKAFM